jgi:hypothetical protein
MPTNVVKTPADEEKWEKAKAQAAKQGKAENYAYIMGIYKSMNPERFKSAQRVAARYAARKGPPMQMGSAALLKRQGLIPVDVFFGEARPHKRPIIELGDGLQDRRGNLHFFVGVDERGKAILADTMDKAKRLHRKLIEDRKHHTTAKNVAARFQLKQAKPEKALYTAVFLDDPNALKRWWVEETGIPLLSKHYCHHMTIKFKPDAQEVVDLPIGKAAPLRIVGWVADAKGQVVKVESSVRSTNKIAHVTVATDGTSPVYSNKLLAKGVEPASGRLGGRVGYQSTKGREVFDLKGTIYEALSKMGPRKAMLPEQVTDERDHDVRRDEPEDGGGSMLPGSEEEE